MCRRRLPLPAGSHSAKGRPPLWSAPPRELSLLAAALAGGASARRLPSYGDRTRSRSPLTSWPRVAVCIPLATEPAEWPRAGTAPLRAGPDRSWPPLCRGPRLQPVTPLHGGLGCSWSPLAGGWPPLQGGWLEIVYPCIPDPDGEDEGGQASSSLAVSRRWISTAKLPQSDLATLA
ncbi:hypothetical protein BHM03_00042093 [Ensete ventricosum]|nr:hypothetical protein BHM03_00042093 [Ensete ventricosum]